MTKRTVPVLLAVTVVVITAITLIWRLASARTNSSAQTSGTTPTSRTLSAAVASLSPDEARQAYDAAVKNLRDRITRMRTLVSALPADAVDVELLARSLKTPEAAFAYVRDGIALEPYAGVMKGASGTLASRGGNAADRAILLATLLAQNGIQAKVARGTLSPQKSGELLQHIGARPGALEQIARVLPASLPPAQISADEQRAINAMTDAATTRATAHRAEADASAATVRAMLAKAGIAAPPDWSAAQLTALRDHFWVQASVGGQTVDLDPSFASAQIGQRLTEPAETFAVDRIPEALYHRLEIRIVVTVVESGRLVQEDLVRAGARAKELFNQNIRISVLPEAIERGPNTYEATVTLGQTAPVRKSFTLRPGGAKPQKPFGGAAGGVLDAFGGGEEKEKQPEGDGRVLGRLAVEIVAKAPILGEAKYRRVILDRLDDDDQAPRLQAQLEDDETIRSLLLQVWDGTIAVGAVHPLLMLKHQLDTLTAQQPVLERALAAKYLGQAFDSQQVTGPRLPTQIAQFFFQKALGHQLVVARETPMVRVYYFRPQLALLRHGVGVNDWSQLNESRRFQDTLDLVNQPYGVAGTAADAARVTLHLGIADATLERALAKDDHDFSTIPLLAAADQQKIPLQAVRPNQDATIRQLQVPESIRRVLLDELRRGRTLIVPTALVALNQVQSFGWWSVDPESGTPLGQMDLGAGQGAVETAKLTEATATMSHTIGKLYGGIVGCFFMEAGRQLGAEGGRSFAIPATAAIHPDEPLAECIAAKVCEAVIEYSFLAGDVASFHHRNWYQQAGWMGLMMFGPAIVSHFACH